MNITYKEQLSRHVENIFIGYAKPGLHICDIATGGGKSYTIGKLTCQYYPEKFDRIVILCVQNKLVNSMNREIDHFINSEGSQDGNREQPRSYHSSHQKRILQETSRRNVPSDWRTEKCKLQGR